MEQKPVERKQHIRRNFISGVAQKTVAMLLPFVVRTIVLYTLGEMYLGLNSLFVSVLQVLSIAELGVGSAIVFSMYKPMAVGDKKKVCALLGLYKKLYRIIGISVLVLGLGIALFLPLIVKEQLPDGINLYILYAIHLANSVFSYFFFAYREALLNASQRLSVMNTINMALNIFVSSVQILLLLVTKNYYYYCAALIVGTVLRNVFTYFASRRIFPEIEPSGKLKKEEIADIKKRVAGLFCYKLCSVTRNAFDTIILTALLGLVIAGRYNNYYLIFTVVMGFIQLIAISSTASVGNSIAVESQQKNHEDFEQLILLYLWVAGACTGCLLLLYQPFMKLWAGADKMFSNGIMAVICAYFFINSLGVICNTYRSATGIWWEDRYRPMVEAVMNPVLNVLLVKLFGTVGVVLSTIICLVTVGNIWGSYALFKIYFTEYSQKSYLLKLFFYTVVTGMACGTAYLVVSLLKIDNLFARMPFAVIIPNIVFFLVYRKLPEFKGLAKRLCSLVPKRFRAKLSGIAQ